MHIWNISFSLTSYTSTSFLVVCTQESFNLMSTVDDDQPDEWDQRIINTGCHEENLKLQLCHADTGDWRKCLEEMAAFRKCWEVNNNNERTKTVNNEEKWK
ncbi:cytochrome oxidase assembly factor 4 [[Candida] railenensis]|uniref:Cytochrome oxidase assembly factor 4 n=1 Tax=[Candida] railenensis TaxID=45579 RepID=A0A9P0QU40_9ASCO|nr:cytochrome oxidase assembly factor 4 [[Candida] railenensis]